MDKAPCLLKELKEFKADEYQLRAVYGKLHVTFMVGKNWLPSTPVKVKAMQMKGGSWKLML